QLGGGEAGRRGERRVRLRPGPGGDRRRRGRGVGRGRDDGRDIPGEGGAGRRRPGHGGRHAEGGGQAPAQRGGERGPGKREVRRGEVATVGAVTVEPCTVDGMPALRVTAI